MVAATRLVEARREAVEATAAFLVDQYNDAGVAAMVVGDRDLALGPERLRALAARARFPFLAANLVDAATGRPVFAPHAIVERAGLRIGLIGLLTVSEANAVLQSLGRGRPTGPDGGRPPDAELAWRVDDPVEAARASAAELRAAGVDLIVALSHLQPAEEASVAEAVPDLRLLLGGHAMAGGAELHAVGGALSVTSGSKGKQVGLLTLRFAEGADPGAPVVDPNRRRALETRRARVQARVKSTELRLAQAQPREVPVERAAPRRAASTAQLEQQLAAAKAELALVDLDLDELPSGDGVAGNQVAYELVNLGRDIRDDPEVKAEVDAFRQRYPDPASPPRRAPSPPGGP